MGRWEPNARGRLEEAALELYLERGYAQTTVAAIAERAGLTERTFFRHFADKREVLFGGGMVIEDLLVRAVADAPADATPYDVVATALQEAAVVLEGRREVAPRRQAVIDAHPELQERELGKLSSWAASLTRALVERDVEPRLAGLVAQTGLAVFRVAFETWVADVDAAPLTEVLSRSFEELRGAASPTP
ncbi:TetR family transcriptional regulator [Nocardioides sp. Root1257]|uniref:TetR/AcrR family transcriptional regulator n=1 Tax=unclassified Nocardioides TaxID=2615069 RepID=UPI0006F306F0|nr:MULTISPECIES: TetR/AcrR family transcriptional regulator [unclassified Nocardioides]KQW53490.1 TetR family transcriptional regulator [Nocardioides sp. Root1257]KRC56176.1 TetR family transcriptional regulator [Nocardioides sp. Root224]